MVLVIIIAAMVVLLFVGEYQEYKERISREEE